MSFYLSNSGHVVNALAPVDINGGVNSDVWSMKDWDHASVVISLGVTGAASTVTLQECDNFTPSNSTAIAFDYYSETTAAGDTLSTKSTATTSGFATSTNDGVFYVVEIDSAELSDGYPNLRVCFSNPSASTFASVAVVLSGGRNACEASGTAIA
jgi:hypothetical protein